MTESPSPVHSHFEDLEKRSVSSGYQANNTYNPRYLEEAPDAPLPVEPERGFWRYVPFQYMSLKPKIRNPYVTTAIACMGGILFGFASVNLSAFIGRDAYAHFVGTEENPGLSAIDQSGMTGCMPGGAFLGAIFSMFFAERIGRRGMVQFSALIFVIGSAIQTGANNNVALAFGRIIGSMGVGTASANVPMYLAEMVPAHQRGMFLSCFQLCVNLGMLIMFYLSFGCTFIKGESSFRLAWGLQMIPGALMLVGAMFLHESPRWLASKGRWDEVVEVLCAINHAGPEDPAVQAELTEFQKDLEVKAGGFLDLFKKKNIHQTFCAGFAMFTQQYVGCNAIVYFSTGITSQVGYTGNTNTIMGSIDYCVLVGATLLAVMLSRFFDRRWNMMLGSLGLLTCMAVVAGLEASYGEPVGPGGVNGDPSVRWNVEDPKVGKAALAFSYIYLGFFSLSWGPMAWVYVGEVFNQDVRTVGNAFASIVNWMFNFTLTIYVSAAFEQIVWKTYVIFAVFCFISIPTVFFFFPETSGYELEQINAIFNNGVPAWKTDPVYKWFMRSVLKREVDLPVPTEAEVERKRAGETEHAENVVNIN